MQQYISIYLFQGTTTLLQLETTILLHMALCSSQAQAEALIQQQFPLWCEETDFVKTFLALKHWIQSLFLYVRESLHIPPPPQHTAIRKSQFAYTHPLSGFSLHKAPFMDWAERSLATANVTNGRGQLTERLTFVNIMPPK